MKTKIILLCVFLCTSCVSSLEEAYYDQSHSSIWVDARYSAICYLREALSYIERPYGGYVIPDSVVSDSVIPDKRIVKDGEMHHLKYVKNGKTEEAFYYRDRKNHVVEVFDFLETVIGQPYANDDYYYIESDGLVTFNTIRFIEMLLWCANVFLSPWLWFALLICLIYRGVEWCFFRLKKQKSDSLHQDG